MEYRDCIPRKDFDLIPKSVWANIAISFAICRIDEEPKDRTELMRQVRDIVVHEWKLLHQQGIVPQKPRVK